MALRSLSPDIGRVHCLAVTAATSAMTAASTMKAAASHSVRAASAMEAAPGSSVEAFASVASSDEAAVVGVARSVVDAVVHVIIVVSFLMQAIPEAPAIPEAAIAEMSIGKVLPAFKVAKIMVEVAVETKRREAYVKR